VVIEEGLSGPEVSVFAVCDGSRAVALPPAQDFKRVDDGDRGPNTGGMGAWSPVPFGGPRLAEDVIADFVEPTLDALRRRGADYRGVLYVGLMITPQGPKLVEYNVRLGDPDGQVSVLRVTSDLAALLAEAADGKLRSSVTTTDDAAVVVVAASEGYPASPRTGDVIEGLAAARAVRGATILCAGVAAGAAGGLVTAGGRVLDVVGQGPDVASARARAYEALSHISWPGLHHRTDIGG